MKPIDRLKFSLSEASGAFGDLGTFLPFVISAISTNLLCPSDWAKEHPKEAKELAAKILKDKGGNPDLAKY